MTQALAFLYNPHRFMAFSAWAAPLFGALALALAAAGLWLGFTAPEDYQQGDTVRIMFIHVPAAWLGLFVYVCLGGASFLSLVFRQGSLWGKPMWGAWWVWDARLTSVLVLFLFYLAYMALRASIDDEAKGARAAAILALVGLINVPVVHWSVEWWNTLHQGRTVFAAGGSRAATVFLVPLLLMSLSYMSAFGALWLVRIRGEVWRRRAAAAEARLAR